MSEVTLQPQESADDCLVYKSGVTWVLSLTDNENQVGYWDSNKWAIGGGMRFPSVPIEQQGEILAAYISVHASFTDGATVVNSYISGELVGDAAVFSNIADYQARSKASAVVAWDNISTWTAGQWYNSPSIVSIIQEIVNQGTWGLNNALVLFWDDHDNRTTGGNNRVRRGHSYNYGSAYAIKLYVEYAIPPLKGYTFFI